MLRLALLASAAVLAGLVAGCGATSSSASDSEVVFGAAVELSGPLQIYAVPIVAGLEAGAAAINDAGGIEVSGETYRATVEVADNRSDPGAVASAAQKVVQAGAIAGVGGSLASSVYYKTFEDAGIITFTGAFDLQLELAEDPRAHPRLFTPVPFYERVYTSGMKRVAALFPDIDRVAILSPNSAEGAGALDTYRASATNAGMRVVHGALYPVGSTDFSAELTAIKAKSPDLLIALQAPAESIAIIQQAAQLGVAEYALNESLTPSDVLGAEGIADIGVMIPAPAPTFSEPATIPDYDPESVFGDEVPPIPGATIAAYYTYRMLAQAIEEAGTVDDPMAIARALAGQSLTGPFGTCRITEKRDLRCESMLEVVRGGAVDVYRFPDPHALEPIGRYVCHEGSCKRR